MKVPFSWLKQYVDIDVTAQELEEKLFGCGFEVEELIDLGGEDESDARHAMRRLCDVSV